MGRFLLLVILGSAIYHALAMVIGFAIHPGPLGGISHLIVQQGIPAALVLAAGYGLGVWRNNNLILRFLVLILIAALIPFFVLFGMVVAACWLFMLCI